MPHHLQTLPHTVSLDSEFLIQCEEDRDKKRVCYGYYEAVVTVLIMQVVGFSICVMV